jgi:hypothetical protein
MKPLMEISRYSIPVLRKTALLGAAATTLLLVSAFSQAQIVQNGGFESTTSGYGQISNGSGPAGTGVTAATNWTTGGYSFVMNAANAATGVSSQYGSDDLALWTASNGGTGTIIASPDGGNFLALDGDYLTSAVSQNLTGLTVGDNYAISFYWAAAQQQSFTGNVEESLTVSLGSQTQSTSTYDLTSKGFSGWMSQTDTFTATSSSEVLSFLAVGNVQVPPFVLLDGISATQVPEGGASSIYLLLAGAVCFGILLVVQRKRLIAKAL